MTVMQADVAERLSEIEWPATIDGHVYYGAEPDGTLIGDDHPRAFDTQADLMGSRLLPYAHGNPVPGDGPPPGG